MLTAKGSPSTRVTACTPGTFNRLGTCSVSYTSLNNASLSRSTSMLATNRYLDLIGIASSLAPDVGSLDYRTPQFGFRLEMPGELFGRRADYGEAQLFQLLASVLLG